ncbi:MAG: preprotein translocase subunit YajC [Planctomycetota bacterium]|nr:preprotein translocase subunit YajC [Planctomycetota bacterium]
MMFDLDMFTLTLAQDGAAGVPGQEAAPGAPPDGTGPGGGGAGGAGGGSPFGPQFLILMLGVLVVMIVMSVTGQRRERKKRQAMLSSIKKHDRVQTVGGVIGSIVEIKPDFVVLKVDESSNTRITFARSSIQQVISPTGEANAT